MKKLLVCLLLLPALGFASEAAHLDKAPIDLSDDASLQRGAKIFVNHCLNCHSANYMRYNRLQDIGLTEEQIKNNLLFAGEKVGDTMRTTMNPKEAKKWFGVTPPDLSVEIRARGADWVYTYLRSFYRDETSPTGWKNCVFDQSCNVAMPHVLYEYQGEQVKNAETGKLQLAKPGKMGVEEYNAMIGDLTNFMAYMSEPAKRTRQYIGIAVLLFLGVMLVLAKKIKAEYWKDIK